MSAYLEIKNLSKIFENKNGTRTALKDINLKVNKNEFITILGPSGCGKSTLLKIIGGFLEPEQGAIYKNDKAIEEPGLDRIMVFQEFEQLFPWKTVLGNVIFALKAAFAKDRKNLKTTARSYLKRVQLEDYEDYYPHQLSGGMKQRTALARTLAAQGEIMLMDEPFGSLDSQTRRSLQSLLMEIWEKQQRTVIFVTHDIREAVFLADRIVVLNDEPGQIEAIVDNNLDRPRSRISSGFEDLVERLQQKI